MKDKINMKKVIENLKKQDHIQGNPFLDSLKQINLNLQEQLNNLQDSTISIHDNFILQIIPFAEIVFNGECMSDHDICKKYTSENETVVLFGPMQNRAGFLLVKEPKEIF